MTDKWSPPARQDDGPVRKDVGRGSSKCTHDGRCQFRLGQRRCPAIGNICDSASAPGPWFCVYHAKNPTKDTMAAQVLDEMERAKPQAPVDWREQMVQAGIQKMDLIRGDDERQSAFIARCYQAMPQEILKKLGLTIAPKESK